MQITVTESGEKKVEAKDGTIRLDENKNRLLSHDGSTNLLFIGQRSDGSIGWDLAPPGTEVTTADLADLIASDRFRAFTIADSDYYDLTRGAGVASVSHDIGTGIIGAPMYLSKWSYPSSSPQFMSDMPSMVAMTSGANEGKIFRSYSSRYDPTNGVIRFQIDSMPTINPAHGVAETVRFHYFILYQNLPN